MSAGVPATPAAGERPDGPRPGRLAGRVALVTGAGGGQGAAVCRRFAAEGARVLATDATEAALARGLEAARADGAGEEQVAGVVADLADPAAARTLVDAAVARFGALDVLYNNAAVRLQGRGDAPTAEIETDAWDLTFAVNARGSFLLCKHALPHLIASGYGVIVNVTSVAGYRGDPDCHAYSATKGALIALTMSLAQTYGEQGVRAVALAPGFIETPMVSAYLEPDARDAIAGITALRRVGSSEEVAAAAAFLASDDASFVTAVVVPVHGGLAK